jgi:hypothetical protein
MQHSTSLGSGFLCARLAVASGLVGVTTPVACSTATLTLLLRLLPATAEGSCSMGRLGNAPVPAELQGSPASPPHSCPCSGHAAPYTDQWRKHYSVHVMKYSMYTPTCVLLWAWRPRRGEWMLLWTPDPDNSVVVCMLYVCGHVSCICMLWLKLRETWTPLC